MAPSQKDGACPEDKPPQPDWAKVFTDLLCHTSVGIFDIPKMTIPQIDAIRSKLGENIALKVGMPGLFGGDSDTSTPPSDGKPSKISEWAAFANAFNGI